MRLTFDVRPGLAALAALGLVAVPCPVTAQSLNINFGDYYAPNVSSTFAGAAGQAGTWDWITQTGTTAALTGLGGNATGVSLSLTADVADGGFGPHPFTDVQDLADSNFFDFGGQGGVWSVSLTGLQSGPYDVYVYAPANIAPVYTTAFTLNGTPEAGIPGDKSNGDTLIPGVSYGHYSGVSVGANGTLTLAEIGTSSSASGIAGLQIVRHSVPAVPEPSVFVLLGLGLLPIGLIARRRLAGNT